MNIKYYGHACFSIKKDQFTIVTDPFTPETGLTLPSLKANAVTVSYNSSVSNNISAVEGNPMILNWPGEYETGGIHFKGIHSFHNHRDDEKQEENVIFNFSWGKIRFCHLGSQGTKLTPDQLEQVGDVDILFVPVGGKECVDSKKAKEIIEQIEPRVVVPMLYHTEGSTLGLDGLDNFLSVMGAGSVEPVDEFIVKKSELPEDNSKVVILNRV